MEANTVSEKRLSEFLRKIAFEQHYNNFTIITKKAITKNTNFNSKLYKATIIAPDRSHLHLFAKLNYYNKEIRSKVCDPFFIAETKFYTNIRRIFENIQDYHNLRGDTRVIFPNFYGMNSTYLEEIYVFQDLMELGYQEYDGLKSLDWEYAAAAMELLAKFHALSMAYEIQHPREAEALFRDMKYCSKASFEVIEKENKERIFEVVNVENKDKVKRFFEKHRNYILDPTFMGVRRRVLAHGDFRPSNILHRFDQNGKLRLMLVDYQTLHTSSVVIDLLYFIFSSSDAAFRRNHYRQILDLYYEKLCEALQRLGVEPNELYSRDDFDYELKTMLPYGLLIGGYTQFMIIMTASERSTDENTIEHAARSIQLFAQRFNEIVNEYIEWGIL